MHFCADEMVAIITFLGCGTVGAKMLAIRFHLWWQDKFNKKHNCHLKE